MQEVRVSMQTALRTLCKGRWGYAFIAPSFALFALFFLVPVVWGYWASSTTRCSARPSCSLRNYRRSSKTAFWLALRNTALYTLGIVPLWLGKALIISALIFWPSPSRPSSDALTHVTSSVITSMVWLWIFNPPFGLLNYFMDLLGLPPHAWLGDVRTALPAIIFMQVVMGGGSSIVMITAAMGSIPYHLYEAAYLDGATRTQAFFRVTIPLLRPTLLYLLVTGTISSFQVFTNVYMMTQGGPQFSTVTLVYLIYDTAFKQFVRLASARRWCCSR